jgi:hypothetical protein
MKVYSCIICNSELIMSHTQSFSKLISWVCPVEIDSKHSSVHYRLYTDVATEEISYCQFYTKNFYIYWYKNWSDNMKDVVHIYHNIFPRGQITQQPFLTLKGKDIDFSNLDKYDEKWKKLSIFA